MSRPLQVYLDDRDLDRLEVWSRATDVSTAGSSSS